VVGLGNPGERYRRTRHNAGFMAVDLLAARTRAASGVYGDAWVAEAALGGGTARVLAEHGGSPADLLVLLDDVALELGVIRVRERGSHGGHNGLRSLGESLGTEDFARVRIGVRRGELPPDLVPYVLADFAHDEVLLVQEAVGLAADAVACFLEDGPTAAMNRFNARRP
jgi:PTH1 family peptidyl-tRNA hydrolase